LKIGFDARLISSLGIGRYISGLLPPLAEILESRLVVIARPTEIALVRALTNERGAALPSCPMRQVMDHAEMVIGQRLADAQQLAILVAEARAGQRTCQRKLACRQGFDFIRDSGVYIVAHSDDRAARTEREMKTWRRCAVGSGTAHDPAVPRSHEKGIDLNLQKALRSEVVHPSAKALMR